MKKYILVPIYVLAGSLIFLVSMFVVRGLNQRKQLSNLQATQTMNAQSIQATQTAVALFTDTPVPSSTPTLEPTATLPPPTETLAVTPTDVVQEPPPGCNEVGFVADVTFPDGKRIKPERKFTKTWRLINAGTCTWDSSYTLYFVSGDKMLGPDSKQLVGLDVEPGKIVDVSVNLVSPNFTGTYRGYWGFKNGDGFEFGLGDKGDPIYVEIIVFE